MGCCGRRPENRSMRTSAPVVASPVAATPPVVDTSKIDPAAPTSAIAETSAASQLPTAEAGQNPQTVGNRASWVIKGV